MLLAMSPSRRLLPRIYAALRARHYSRLWYYEVLYRILSTRDLRNSSRQVFVVRIQHVCADCSRIVHDASGDLIMA